MTDQMDIAEEAGQFHGQLDAFELLGVLPDPKPRGKSGRVKKPAPVPTRPTRTAFDSRYTCGHSDIAGVGEIKTVCPVCNSGERIDSLRIQVPA